METKPGFKTSEILALASGLILAVVPVLMDKVPPGSVGYVLLGSLVAVATYIAGRSHVKASTVKAAGIVEATKAAGPLTGSPE